MLVQWPLSAEFPRWHADKQPLLQAPRSLLLIVVSDLAGPFVRLFDGPASPPLAACPPLSLAVASDPPRPPTPVPTAPIPSDRDRDGTLVVPLLRLPSFSGPPSVATADLDTLGDTAECHFGDSTARYSHAILGTRTTRRALIQCRRPIQCSSAGHRPCLPSFLMRFPSHQRPLIREDDTCLLYTSPSPRD